MLERWENKVIRKYGYEHRITLLVCRVTEILRKITG